LLVLFKHVEVLLRQLDQLNTRVLVWREFKADVFPSLLELCKGLLHLGLLSGLVGDLFNILLVLAKVEFIDVLENKVFINSEFGFDLLLEVIPMSVSHVLVSQFSNQREEDKPLLDLIDDTKVGIASLVTFHVFQSLLELLDLVFHLVWLDSKPFLFHIELERFCATVNVVPKQFHVIDSDFDLVNVLDCLVNL
jgi:hypothetical protein